VQGPDEGQVTDWPWAQDDVFEPDQLLFSLGSPRLFFPLVKSRNKPGLQPGGWRFDPARLHSMLNESDRITSHLLFQRPESRPSALNPTRAPSSSLRHLRHCVIPIEANPPAAIRRAHHHRHCVICVICVTASHRSKPTRQPPPDARTIIVTASSASSASLRHTDRSQPASRDPTRAPSKIAFGCSRLRLLSWPPGRSGPVRWWRTSTAGSAATSSCGDTSRQNSPQLQLALYFV